MINRRHRAGRSKHQLAGISMALARTSIAFAALMAVVLLITAALLSATGPAGATPQQAAQQTAEEAIPVVPDTESMSDEDFAVLLASAELGPYAREADGYWWTQSLRNASDTSNFLTHAGTTFALKAIAATEHDTAGVADVER